MTAAWIPALLLLADVSLPALEPEEARIVPVTIVTDAAFRSQGSWRGLARGVIERGTEDLAKLTGLRFQVVEERTWEPRGATLPEILDDGLRAVGPVNGIAVFLLGRRGRSGAWGEEVGYALLARPALVIDTSEPVRPGLGRKDALGILFRHELGHVFGVPHRPPPDVMAQNPRDRRASYGPIPIDIMRAMRGIDFTARTPFAGADLTALADLYHALAAEPGMEPALLVNLGIALLAADHPGAAQRVFTDAARLDPESISARLGLAQCALAAGDSARARSVAEILSEEPDLEANVLTVIGSVWLDLGERERAAALFSRAVARDPDAFTPRFRLGLVRFHAGEYLEARDHFARALEIEERPEAWFNLGLCCDALRDRESALAAFRRALRIDPYGPLAADCRKFVERLER